VGATGAGLGLVVSALALARVPNLVEAVGTSQSNVSQHLAILREKGILGTRRSANRVYYSVRDQRTLQLIATMREVLCGTSARS